MHYSPWGELSASGLELVWATLPGRLGEYAHDLRRITLDPRMRRRQARSVLAHELAHARAGDIVTACDRVNLRQEQRADREAARLMVDVRDLGDAIALHGSHHSAVAVELHVSDYLLRIRLAHLHPAERHHLIRRMEAHPDGC